MCTYSMGAVACIGTPYDLFDIVPRTVRKSMYALRMSDDSRL